jgi:hypothetical protein
MLRRTWVVVGRDRANGRRRIGKEGGSVPARTEGETKQRQRKSDQVQKYDLSLLSIILVHRCLRKFYRTG